MENPEGLAIDSCDKLSHRHCTDRNTPVHQKRKKRYMELLNKHEVLKERYKKCQKGKYKKKERNK